MSSRIYYQHNYIAFGKPELQDERNEQIIRMEAISNQSEGRELVKTLLNEEKQVQIYLPENEFEKTLAFLKSELRYIEAAGGLIEKDGEFLCIHRLGRWDLPKGKLEKKESPEKAAVRECEEECGIKELKILRPLKSTFHIYPHKKGFALKQTYWYYMSSTYDQPLIAQTEENIDEVKWFGKEQMIETILPDTYFTISDVIREGLGI